MNVLEETWYLTQKKKKRHGIVALDWIDKKGYVMEFSIVYNQVT